MCARLSVSASWLTRHRAKFKPVAIPGRGRNGQEYRYPAKSVEEFLSRGQETACTLDDCFTGKTMLEMFEILKRRNGGSLT